MFAKLCGRLMPLMKMPDEAQVFIIQANPKAERVKTCKCIVNGFLNSNIIDN